jgi:hypothetical protein
MSFRKKPKVRSPPTGPAVKISLGEVEREQLIKK